METIVIAAGRADRLFDLPSNQAIHGNGRSLFKLTLFRQESIEVRADVLVLAHALTSVMRSTASARCAFGLDLACDRHSNRMPLTQPPC